MCHNVNRDNGLPEDRALGTLLTRQDTNGALGTPLTRQDTNWALGTPLTRQVCKLDTR